MTNFAKSKTATRLLQGLAGLLVGGGLGFLIGRLIKAGDIDPDRLAWSDELAGLLAVILMAVGLFVAVSSLSRRATGRMIDPDADRAATPAQTSFFRQQALVMILAGAMLAAPVVAAVAFDPLPTPIATAVMMGIIAAFLIQTAYNLLVWRRSDELLRRITSESAAASFWILQGALFLWAAAEKLGLAPALSTWDMVTVLMAAYLLLSVILQWRRGMV